MKNVLILGATGTIGEAALRAYRKSPSFRVCGIVARNSMEKLSSLAKQYMTGNLVLTGGDSAMLKRAIETSDADIVLNGISGKDGLDATVFSIGAGKDIALANKESVVMAGPQILQMAEKRGVRIIPVDSEHSSVYWILKENPGKEIDRIVITASGGPFRTFQTHLLETVTPRMALKHPTWKMGKKISIDSASLANKGLEVIEAMRLFNLPAQSIQVVVNPESRLHGAVIFKDGSARAAISEPDMAYPIARALSSSGTNTRQSQAEKSSAQECALSLTFEKPDLVKFPMLALGYEAARKTQVHQIAYNAADEVAAEAFLCGRIGFTEIHYIAESVVKCVETDSRLHSLAEKSAEDHFTIADIYETDRICREIACYQLA